MIPAGGEVPTLDRQRPPRRCVSDAAEMPRASSVTSSTRPRVLVLGGGFAGLGAAKALEKAPVDVQVVDGHDYHTFQPMLYQLATGAFEATVVAHYLHYLF